MQNWDGCFQMIKESSVQMVKESSVDEIIVKFQHSLMKILWLWSFFHKEFCKVYRAMLSELEKLFVLCGMALYDLYSVDMYLRTYEFLLW